MATGCLWDGTAETAEFLHLFNATFHCSARGSEVSLAKVRDLAVAEVNEDVCQCQTLQLDTQRQARPPFSVSVIRPTMSHTVVDGRAVPNQIHLPSQR